MLGYAYGWIGLVATEQGCDVVAATREAEAGEETRSVLGHVAPGAECEVALTVSPQALVSFHLRAQGRDWHPAGVEFTAREGQWIGAELVLFSAAPLGGAESLATFGAVEIEVGR